MITTLIVDDESIARQAMRQILNEYCPQIEIIGEAHDIESGFKLTCQHQPQLIFLDINLNEELGFDLLDKFPQPTFKIIFITGHNDFAVKAFEYNALDYLLKPINAERIIQAVNKVSKLLDLETYQQQITSMMRMIKTQQFKKISIPTAEGLQVVSLEDIQYLSASSNYTLLHLKDGSKLLSSRSLKNYETLLPQPLFFRCHQSYIINTNFIKRYIKEDGGQIELTNEIILPVSRRKRNLLMNLLTN